MLTRRNIDYKRSRIVRIIVTFNNTNISCGTGFFVASNGLILTCGHVILGADFKNVLQHQEFINAQGSTNKEKAENYHKLLTHSIKVELEDGALKEVILKSIDPGYDIALLQIEEDNFTHPYLETDLANEPYYGEEISFYGFPDVLGHTHQDSPFVINRSIVSTFPEVEVAGERYRHMQINATTIGGISGAPIFRGDDNTVVGIINGNYNWDFPNIVSRNNGVDSVIWRKVISAIGYATSLKVINDHTNIFSV